MVSLIVSLDMFNIGASLRLNANLKSSYLSASESVAGFPYVLNRLLKNGRQPFS